MDHLHDPRPVGPAVHNSARSFAATFIVSSLSVGLSFAVANSELGFALKTSGFSMIVAAFLAVWVLLYFRSRAGVGQQGDEFTQLERDLRALDEAREYLAGSIGVSDTFRLVMSRTASIVPSATGSLWLLDASRMNLVCEEAVGDLSQAAKGKSTPVDKGLGAECYAKARILRSIGHDKQYCGIAIPLIREGTAFAVLEFVSTAHKAVESIDDQTFEALGSRVSPLILSAIAFDRSRANALTDPTTDLPNERAFYLILENQIAEASRKRMDRPLTILAMEVKNFDEINSRFGHATGDAVIEHVARTVKESLRQMDFFARCRRDEFLAILPTVGGEAADDVMERFRGDLASHKVRISQTEAIGVDLNFGWASFGADGETADAIVTVARSRRADETGVSTGNVLRFSRELVN